MKTAGDTNVFVALFSGDADASAVAQAVGAFREGEEPLETFRDGVAVVEMLMALYRSAETGSTVYLPDDELETYVPPVVRGESG